MDMNDHDIMVAVAEATIRQNVPEPIDEAEREKMIAYILDNGIVAFIQSRREG